MKTIWVNGCFDILHVGHVALFKYAKSLGDKLIVGIDSDERVRELKGESRPFNNVNDRMTILSALKYIDEVVQFNSEEELTDYIKVLNVDTMVVGDDYRDKRVVGSENAKEVKFFSKLDNYSTTSILEYENIHNKKQ